MPRKILEEPFHLTDADANVSGANTTAATWSDMFKYQVPQGVVHLLKPEHTISAYLKDASLEITAPDAQIKIEVRDPAEQDKVVVFGPAMYQRVKEFQDKTKMAHLAVPTAGHPVRARDWIVIMVKDDAAVIAATSYFDLLINRIRESVI